MRTLIRTFHESGQMSWSWYDKNGRRYRHIKLFETREVDNEYGFMAYVLARPNIFNFIDDYVKEHPKRLF